ncbi:hypothetical protein D3C73_1044660 [compost metagenome]
MQKGKPVGQTLGSGFQVGVRRTFPISIERAWDHLISTQGAKIWLGDISSIDFQKGQEYLTEEGISGEVRVVNQFVNIRLSWKKNDWVKPSTLQIRTIPKGSDKTTISIHQENLSDSMVREEMKAHWENVLNRLSEII